MSTAELDEKFLNASRGDACIRMNLHMQKKELGKSSNSKTSYFIYLEMHQSQHEVKMDPIYLMLVSGLTSYVYMDAFCFHRNECILIVKSERSVYMNTI